MVMSEETKQKISKAKRGKKLSLEHKKKISIACKGKKLSSATKEKIRKAKTGKTRKPFSAEWLNNLSVAQQNRKYYKPVGMTGKVHSKETKIKMSEKAKGNKNWLGKKHSKKTKNLLSKIRIGAKNPAWKKGSSALSSRLRNINLYYEWRLKVFERDKFTCQECGDSTGGNLQAHHIIAFADLLQTYKITSTKEGLLCKQLWELSNGITLCTECHKLTDSYAKNRKKT